MPHRLTRIVGSLCLLLALSFSGCTKGPYFPIRVAENPHVYSSEDPNMQAYVREEEEIRRIRRTIKTLKAQGIAKADIRKLRDKIRQLENARYEVARKNGTPNGSRTLDQEFKAFLRENNIPWPHGSREMAVGEAAEDPRPSPVRVRFGDGPMEVAE